MVGRPGICTSALLCGLFVHALAAQEPTYEFELVSVKRSSDSTAVDAPQPRPSVTVAPGGRFEARRQTVADLARVAFGFEQVDPATGLVEVRSKVASSRRFDVTATSADDWTAPPPGTDVPTELRAMLRALLEDRFKLKARFDTKTVEVTALRLANPKKAPGPGLRPSGNACLGPFTNPPRTDRDRQPPCPFSMDWDSVTAGSVTMPEVASLIAVFLDRRRHLVVDQTSLEGTYDLVFSMGTPAQGSDPTSPKSVPRLLEIREALRTQLGLELENARLPVPVLVIDEAQFPRED
jgi:uncharacterized protein (TIGR03435 family)